MLSKWKMGNSLCKGQKENSPSDGKTPIGRVIDRCAGIFPPSLGKKKHIWSEKVLETSSPVEEQPKQVHDGWTTPGLGVPDQPPVAPPRKKRISKIKKEETEALIANGVKENFNEQGKEVQPDKVPEEVKLPEEGDTPKKPVTVTRKVSKVGNKKSDKFFGESLSDLSNEAEDNSANIQKSDTDETDKASEPEKPEDILFKESVTKSTFVEPPPLTDELMKEMQNETARLLFSLKTQCAEDDSSAYEGRVPAEEAIIVPVRKKTRHVCDLEEQLCDHLHNPMIFVDPNAPKKPQRDFGRYKRNSETSNGEDSLDTVDTTEPTKTPAVAVSAELIEKEQKHSTDVKTEDPKVPEKEAKSSPAESNLEVPETKPKSIVTSKSEPYLGRAASEPPESPGKDGLVRKISVPEKNLSRSEDTDLRKNFATKPFSAELRKQITDILKMELKSKTGQPEQPDKAGSRESVSSSQNNVNSLKVPHGERKRVSFSEDREDSVVKTTSTDATDTYSEKAETEKPEKTDAALDCDGGFLSFETFMKDNHIQTEDFLDFLEAEMGDLLSSQWLIEKEKILEQFKKAMSEKEAKKQEEETNQNEESQDLSEGIVVLHPEIEERQKEETEVPTVSDTDEVASYFVDTEIQNRFKLSKSENMKPSDKRRHSIDDLDLWFSARKTSLEEKPAKKRRRKRSNSEGPQFNTDRARSQSLDEPKDTSFFISRTPPPILIEREEKEPVPLPTGGDHSPLLKFFDKTKSKEDLETNANITLN